MKPVILLGHIGPPEWIDAATIRALRSPEGAAPCADGLRDALAWIGDRRLPFAEALAEAREALNPGWVEWAEKAIGVYGDGSGYGDGYGYGYGSANGDGSSDGYGSANGDGSGYGDGYGYGYGSANGDGSGDGYGSANGDGSGYGDGDSSGYGDGYGNENGYSYDVEDP